MALLTPSRKRRRPATPTVDPAEFRFLSSEERDILLDKVSRTSFQEDANPELRPIVGFNAVMRALRRGTEPLCCIIPHEDHLSRVLYTLQEACRQAGVPVLAMRGSKDRLARSIGAKRVLALAVVTRGDGGTEHMLTRYLLQLTGEGGDREQGPSSDAEGTGPVTSRGGPRHA